MKQILLSLLLLCSLSAFAQDKEVKRQKKTQTTTVDQRKAEQEAARKREEAKRREQARQEQRRKEQQERERQARIEQQRREQARREQEERERQAILEEQRREQARREQEERERRNALHWDESQKALCYNGQTYSMVRVQGGTFNMGATLEREAYDDEKPVHQVTLSSYYIGKYEVTQDLWQAVMGSNPSKFKGSRKPVEQVSWNDCQTFISKLNSLTGKRFRLPTEAEWEFASRGGTMSRGYKYSGSNTLDNVAWYDGNSGNTTHDVGTKSSNELGIYDMSGNVYEWCSDWKGNYSSSSQTNPTGASSGSFRVNRGGSWFDYARYCRSSFRFDRTPDLSHDNLGLRLVLVP